MGNLTGELIVEHGGKEYKLRLGYDSLGLMQSKYGNGLEALMPSDGSIPDFGAVLMAVRLSLTRHHPDNATDDFADDLLAADKNIIIDLLTATLHDNAETSTGKKPKAAKKKTT